MPTSHFINIHGLEFRYLDYGAAHASQPLIVFYHATGFTSELWEPIIRALQADYHCIALDQRGHGGSDQRAPEYNWQWTVADFQAFLEAMGFTRVIGIGHSSGATSIAVAAARQPALIERMVLIEPTIRPRDDDGQIPPHSQALVERTRNRRARWADSDELKAKLGQRPPYNSWDAEMLDIFARHATAPNEAGEIELRCKPETEATIYASFRQYDPWPYLPHVKQPLLIIHGTGPSVLPTTNVEQIMPLWPQAKLVEIAEGGHLVMMEAPQRVARAIQDFLRETDPRAQMRE